MKTTASRLPGARITRRVLNFGRKLASGLTPFGENVSPEVPNDLFVAHVSIYVFAARAVAGARVLDLGCGAGYGSDLLRKAGASTVLGIDVDRRNVRYASRHYPAVRFQQGDAHHLPPDLGTFDLVVASNVLEHLEHIEPALDSIRAMLPPSDGRLLVAVPPIVDDASLKANEAIPYHRSNHMVSHTGSSCSPTASATCRPTGTSGATASTRISATPSPPGLLPTISCSSRSRPRSSSPAPP